MEYDGGDSFHFDFEPNGIHMIQNDMLGPRVPPSSIFYMKKIRWKLSRWDLFEWELPDYC